MRNHLRRWAIGAAAGVLAAGFAVTAGASVVDTPSPPVQAAATHVVAAPAPVPQVAPTTAPQPAPAPTTTVAPAPVAAPVENPAPAAPAPAPAATPTPAPAPAPAPTLTPEQPPSSRTEVPVTAHITECEVTSGTQPVYEGSCTTPTVLTLGHHSFTVTPVPVTVTVDPADASAVAGTS